MRVFWNCLLIAGLFGFAAKQAHADILFYTVPGTSLEMALFGRVTVNPGRTVTFVHPTINTQLYFSLNEVRIKRTPTTLVEYNRAVAKAGKNADQMYTAALWGLKKGLIKPYYATMEKVLEANPKHEGAKRVLALKAEMDKPLPDNPALEAELRKIVKRDSMRIAKSNHFLLLHDTPERPAPGRKKNRSQERLALLEQVYESFLLLFHAQDVQLDIPRERMKVVLFNEYDDYKSFSTGLSPSLSSASGFWEPARNVSVFYDHGTDNTFVTLEKLQKQLRDDAAEAKKNVTALTKDIVRFSKTLDFLIEVAQENADIEVVSHEATHQMAGNTGLFPRHVMIPSWVHEGLATYFESPGDASWAGVGAVNSQRLTWYRALEPDREHSNIDFIVGDQIFDYAATHGAKLHGYGQAWALTHYLVENHLKEFVSYYRMLGELPPDVILNQELLTNLFDKSFGTDRKQLDQEWRDYMRKLKTDEEKLEEADSRKS